MNLRRKWAPIMSRDDGNSLDFFDVFREEAEVINARRFAVAQGLLAQDRGYGPEEIAPLSEEGKRRVEFFVEERLSDSDTAPTADRTEISQSRDERGRKVPRPSSGHNLTGLALSGGGIRSAAFCLGVLQAIDAHREDHDPQIIDQVDYLSTVSGGGYIGSALVCGLTQAKGRFPFRSKFDQEETIETQHVRDYSDYLAPNGVTDIIAGGIVILRGLLLNAIIFLGILLLAAAAMICFNPNKNALGEAFWGMPRFELTLIAIAFFLASQVVYAIIVSREWAKGFLKLRERFSNFLSRMLTIVLFIAALEVLFYLLILLADKNLVDLLNNLVSALVAGTLALTAFATAGAAGTLATIVRTTVGDKTWKGSFKRWASLGGLWLAAAIVPLLMIGGYVILCYWGIRNSVPGCNHISCIHFESGIPGWLTGGARGLRHWLHDLAPVWVMRLLPDPPVQEGIVWVYVVAGVVCLALSVFVKPNTGSLHGYYRDRLSRAFLWRLSELRMQFAERTTEASEYNCQGSDRLPDAEEDRDLPSDVDRFTLSCLKSGNGSGWNPRVRRSPYLIVNTAVNLEASKYLNRRGRNADSFAFSPLFIGSEATGYAPTTIMENVDRNINLGTAMAASGAAASANMGAQTIRSLTFSLAVLNVRLGYWIPNPRYALKWTLWNRLVAAIGPLYYAMETFGLLSEKTRNVYVTDGGHFDNLGLYELLKRRCRVIIAVDAEADPGMNFRSFAQVQRIARIDLGTRIDLPWEALRRRAAMIAKSWRRPLHPEQFQGPHVALGFIHYNDEEKGVLIYIKSSISGDENDLVCDYKRRYSAFPHETTADQFFGEEQFEAYRELGFHAAQGFFDGNDVFGMFPAGRYSEWLKDLDQVLGHLNIADVARRKIMARAGLGAAGPSGNNPIDPSLVRVQPEVVD